MNMRVYAVLFLVAGAITAQADYDPSRIWWPRSTVGYVLGGLPKHQYFLGNMLDGDPKTAWMIGPMNKIQGWGGQEEYRAEPAIFVRVPGEGKIDGIRLMPGYNKSEAIFKRNNRITEVEIWTCQPLGSFVHSTRFNKLLAKAELKDSMGWQEVKFEPTDAPWIQIDIKNWVTGSDDDLCVSELQLLRDGKPIDWEMTPVVLSTHGGETQEISVWNVIRKNGEVLRQVGEPWEHYGIDKTGRFVVSWTPSKKDNLYWVLDLRTGNFIAEYKRPRLDGGYASWFEAKWDGQSVTLEVEWEFRDETLKTETFTLSWKDDPHKQARQHRRSSVP